VTINFYKYQGTGNDFIMIDNRQNEFNKRIEVIKHLCNRKFGIGSDGLICLDNHSSLDFYMDFYNPDGSQSFCGNGSRCTVAFAEFLGMVEKTCVFEAIDGMHEARIDKNIYKTKMADISEIESNDVFDFVNTGSPHYVEVLSNISDLDMIAFGRSIRYNSRFKAEGTNVNVMERTTDGILMRTYERGVEHETLSCGTGVTAAALTAIKKGWFKNEVAVSTRGGKLSVQANQTAQGFSDVWLCGPALRVYKGTIDV